MSSKSLTIFVVPAVAVVLAVAFAVWALSLHRGGTPASAAPPSGLSADIVIPPNAQPAPDFNLNDQNGQPISVSALKGKVVAITFLDSHCQQLCPIEADQLAKTQQALGSDDPMTLLVVSVAPTTDTSASERAFAAAHHWSGDWHWLNGPPGELAGIWKSYSIAVQPGTGDVLHSSVLFLIDRKGYERAGWAAGIEPDRLAHDIRLLNSAA